MKAVKTNKTSRTHTIIWLMMAATFLWSVSSPEGKPPTIVKLMFAASLWTVVLIFPHHYIHQNDLGKRTNILLKFVIFLTVVAVIQSAFDTTANYSGNKWVTMFGNDECMFMLLAPCFMYLSASTDSVLILKQASQVMLILGAMSLITGHFVGGGLLWFVPLMLPYMKKGYWVLMLLAVAMAIYNAFFAEDTSRSTIMTLLTVIIAYGCVYVLNSRKAVWIACLTMIIVPLVYSAMMLIDQEYSIIKVVLDIVMQRTGDEQMGTDTRSFLFWEMAEDLSKNHAWLFGKGAYSHYFSDFFSRSTSANSDVGDRLGVEVTLLQLLLRGGIVYATVYYTLIITAVVSALKNSKNRFLLGMAIMASGWCLFSCISYVNGCKFQHLGMFLLMGCCLSKRWLNYSDDDIKKILSR